MSTPGRTGVSGRLRTAGLALFGLALIATVIGLVVAVTRQERNADTGQPPLPSTRAPVSTSVAPSAIPYPPPVPSRPAEAPVVAPSGLPNAGGASAGEGRYHRGEVRVYNNSTIRGLAARAARDLRAAGWTVVEIGNYADGIIPTSTAYYQEGTDQKAAAEALGAEFGMRVEPRFPGIANASPGVIVIVTNDYSH
jgi:hypothetical protein